MTQASEYINEKKRETEGISLISFFNKKLINSKVFFKIFYLILLNKG